MINADQRRQALERPTIIIDGTKYEGKLLSWEEWTPHADAISAWFHGKVSEQDAKAGILAFLAKLFDEATAEKIIRLEPAILEEALVYFFNSHRRFATTNGQPAGGLTPAP